MKQQSREWLQKADDDFIVIQAIIDNELVTNMVAFHAQQAIEKVFKAVLEEYDMGVKKVHNLRFLYSQVLPLVDLTIDTDTLILLDQLYINAHYPGELGLLPDGKPSLDEARVFYETAKDIHSRVTEHLAG